MMPLTLKRQGHRQCSRKVQQPRWPRTTVIAVVQPTDRPG